MTIIEFIKLLRKHLVLLLGTPVILAVIVAYLTRHPDFKFASETKLYTGITTGSSVEMDKSLSYFAASTAFDNLINIIKSRKTQQEVAVKLLAQHLLMSKADPEFILPASFARLGRMTPAYVRKMVDDNLKVRPPDSTLAAKAESDSISRNNFFAFAEKKNTNQIAIPPPGIDPVAYRRTVALLTNIMNSSDTNFVYKLLNFDDPHYSIKAISTVSVQRIGSSDMVQLKYETDDPGICQQTLALMIDACILNFKIIKANQSDAVVKYFEFQLENASTKLRLAEDKLLNFNKENNIINYYEQSKAVAVAKEALDANYGDMKIRLAGIEAATANLEQKLGDQHQLQLKNSDLIQKKNQLGALAYQIATAEAKAENNTDNISQLAELKVKAEKLTEEIRDKVSEFYKMGTSVEGIPTNTLLKDWIDNVIEGENTRAGLRVLGDRINEFQKQYAIYAPAGANVKRIEREISVSEGEYLEILHGLNLARLKLQDNELASNIKTVDPPFYPLSPNKTKRKLSIIIAAFAGFVIVLSIILFLEYFDKTLKSPDKASKLLDLKMAGMLPRILLKSANVNLPFVVNRLLDLTLQNGEQVLKETAMPKTVRNIVIFSTMGQEGKTVVACNLTRKLIKNGEKVLYLNFNSGSLSEYDTETIGASSVETTCSGENVINRKSRPSLLRLLLGYEDNRIDYDSPYLAGPEGNIANDCYAGYKIDNRFRQAATYTDLLLSSGNSSTDNPAYVLIEIPALLCYPVPTKLIENADLAILVCRSNREWNEADNGALENIRRLSGNRLRFFLNGADLVEVETLLGELPRKRSWLRRTVKKIVRLQFKSDSRI